MGGNGFDMETIRKAKWSETNCINTLFYEVHIVPCTVDMTGSLIYGYFNESFVFRFLFSSFFDFK